MYGGEGADELFLGYKTYLDIYANPEREKLSSDYSKVTTTIDSISIESEMQNRLTEDLILYSNRFEDLGMNRSEATVKANGLLDYKYQLPMVGLTASDTVIADCGVNIEDLLRNTVTKICITHYKLINTSIHLNIH